LHDSPLPPLLGEVGWRDLLGRMFGQREAEACIEFPVPVSWTKEKAEIFLREIVWKLATM